MLFLSFIILRDLASTYNDVFIGIVFINRKLDPRNTSHVQIFNFSIFPSVQLYRYQQKQQCDHKP